jgi:hypothetical protein
MRPVFRRGAFDTSPGAAPGINVGSLGVGLVARLLCGDVIVLRQDAQVHHQRICFFIESKLASRHKLISL